MNLKRVLLVLISAALIPIAWIENFFQSSQSWVYALSHD